MTISPAPAARIAVFALGGTISMAPGAVLTGRQLLDAVPGLDRAGARIEVREFRQLPSASLSVDDIVELSAAIGGQFAAGAAGAVVIQGTDTIEETAFCWDLVLDGVKPVVVTGAMRASDEAGFDGPANLRDAVRAAAAPSMRGAGVVVCLAATVEPADDVIKMHASALDTFTSPNGGSLGRIGAGEVTLFRRRAGRRHVETTRAAERVHLITATVAMDGSLLDAAVAAGADGIVVAATGAGNTDPALLAAAERAIAAGLPVALATRCPSGRAGTAYAFPGGGATWVRAGAIPVGHLCAVKARVALALGLGAGLPRYGLAALLADPLP
jgi:L-asparaginase